MVLPMERMPSAISDTVAVTLRAHGLALTPELLAEIGRNTTQALFAIDESPDVERPEVGELLSVGETLRALAAAGRPNPETAQALARVGAWLSGMARAELEKGSKAA